MGLRAGSQITERDRELLGLLAEQRVMVVPQVAAGLGVSDRTAAARLQHLQRQRLIAYEAIFRGQPAATWITRRGLDAIESHLPQPRIDLKGYRHDIGVGWMWLAARGGAFGAVATLTSEREMRSHDLRSDRSVEPFGVALGGIDSYGRMTRHYPDVMLGTTEGTRVALELELTAKSGRRLDAIMRGYAGDGRIDRTFYLVPTESLERLISGAVTRAGISDLVRVGRLVSPVIEGAPEPGGLSSAALVGRSAQMSARPPQVSNRPRANGGRERRDGLER
jgi:hypothetical protein